MELRPGYKQTEVGVIPNEWDARSLLTTVRIATGQVDPKVEPYKSMILVAPDHVESETGRLLELSSASDQGAISGKYLFEPGDIIYSKIRPYLRKAFLATFRGLCSADMYPLKPVQGNSAPFLLAILLGYHFSRFAETVSIRSGIPKINREELAEYVFALPPHPEQCAIAAALRDADALTSELDQIVAKKRAIKQAATQQLLAGQRRFPGFCAAWETKKLGELATMRTGPFGSALHKADYVGNGIPIVNPMHIVDGKIVPDANMTITARAAEQLSAYLLLKGDVVMGRRGDMGRCAVVAEREAGWLCGTGSLIIRPRANIVPEFLQIMLSSDAVVARIEEMSVGTTMINLNQYVLRQLRIETPSRSEQHAIAAVLSDMDAEIAALERRRDKTRALKQGMMQELLTGRTRLV